MSRRWFSGRPKVEIKRNDSRGGGGRWQGGRWCQSQTNIKLTQSVGVCECTSPRVRIYFYCASVKVRNKLPRKESFLRLSCFRHRLLLFKECTTRKQTNNAKISQRSVYRSMIVKLMSSRWRLLFGGELELCYRGLQFPSRVSSVAGNVDEHGLRISVVFW